MAKSRKPKKKKDFFKGVYSFGSFNLAAVSLALALAGQVLLYYFKNVPFGLTLFALAAFFFIIADLSNKKDFREESLKPLVEASAFIFIMAVAVFFRVYIINELPAGCYRDEGQNGNEAIHIMNGEELEGTSLPVYIERWTQNAALYMYFIAAFFKFFGIGVLEIRAVSVVFGILCVPAFYFLVRYLFGPRMAIVGAFLIAVSRWHVNFSRIGFLGIVSVFFVITIMYFAYRVYRKRKVFDFVMLGALTALSLYSYLAARLIPVGLVIFFLYLMITEFKFYRKNWASVAWALAAFFIVIAPLGLYAAKHPENFMSRSSTVSIFNKEMLHEVGGRYVEKDGSTPKHWTKLYMEDLWDTMMMFNYKGDGNPRHNIQGMPMLDFVTGILAFLGFIYALFNWRKPRFFMLLALFAAFLQAGLFSTESPQAYRTIVEIPIVLIFAVIAAGKVMQLAAAQYGREFAQVAMMTGIVLLGYSGYENYDSYFDKFRNNPGSWAEFSTDEYNMGLYVKKLGDDWIAIVQPSWAESYAFNFGAYPVRNFTRFSPSEWIPIQSKEKKNFTYILDPASLPLLPILEKMYPEGKYWDFRHKFYKNEILFFTYEVPYEAVKKYQEKPVKTGLTGYYYRGIEWKGSPVFARRDPFILFNWTIDPVMGPFSVKWVGKIRVSKPGNYTFITSSNDFSDLHIDGKQVLLNKGQGNGQKDARGTIYLSAGGHDTVLRYYESIHYSKMQFFWVNPENGEEEVVPSEILYP